MSRACFISNTCILATRAARSALAFKQTEDALEDAGAELRGGQWLGHNLTKNGSARRTLVLPNRRLGADAFYCSTQQTFRGSRAGAEQEQPVCHDMLSPSKDTLGGQFSMITLVGSG